MLIVQGVPPLGGVN